MNTGNDASEEEPVQAIVLMTPEQIRLAAAAPVLLSALAACAEWLGHLCQCSACDKCLNDAWAAIEKAGGRPDETTTD